VTALQGELLDMVRRDRSRRARRRSFGDFVSAMFVAAVVNLVAGFWFMLAVGVIHHEWSRSCPTIGYWCSVLLVSLLRGAFGQASSSKGADR
jgi:hypothetical protein